MQDTYALGRTGLTVKASETDFFGNYAVEVNVVDADFDGPLYHAVGNEDMLDLIEDLYGEDAEEGEHPEAGILREGTVVMVFPEDDDPERVDAVVEQLVDGIDTAYDTYGEAPLEEYLRDLPWGRDAL